MSITVREAAARLGVSVRRVRWLCERDRIPGAEKIGRDWIIPDPPIIAPPKIGASEDDEAETSS